MIAISPGNWWPEPGICSSATVTPATPLTNPTERSISPIRRTKTIPMAITVVPASCPIRLMKLTELKKMSVWKVK